MQVERAQDCPGENTVVALFEEKLAIERRAEVGDHVEECDSCRQLVAVLAQSRMAATVLGRRMRFARASEAPVELAAGAAVGRYRIERLLGQGGMGMVYAAHDPELDRRVAVKVIRPELARHGAQIAARMAREARAMAQVAHPNVIAVHDVGSAGDQVFVAMELVDGHTLREWLRERPRSWREIVEVFRAAGEGLAAAHDARLVHRDFKPDNVLIDRSGRVRVSDFGLARAVAEEQSAGGDALDSSAPPELTRSGAIIGTPAYMAPEQHGHAPTDARTDQFSFCVALWESLYQERPFPGDNALELADAVIAGELRSAPRRPRVPRWLKRALVRGLQVEPGDRFPTMRALLRAIRPRRSRAIVLAAAASAILAGGGALLFAGDRDQRAVPAVATCAARSEARLAEVWNPARRAEVMRAMPSGSQVELVARAIDRYAAGWTAMHRDACEAGGTDDLRDIRAHCLDTRLADLAVVVSLLGSDDSLVLEQALGAVGALPDLDRCSAVEAIEARTPVPSDPAERTRVEAMRRDLVRVDAHRLAGRFQEARAELDVLLGKAEVLGYKPLVADCLYFLGVLQADTGTAAEAEATLRRAAHTAQAGRYDQLAADAWIFLITVAAQETGNLERAAEYAEHARAALDRLGPGHNRLEGQFRHHMGTLAWAQSQPEAALAHYTESRRLFQEVGDDESALNPTEGMALVYEDQGRVMEAIELHREILDARTRTSGADHPDTSLSHTNLASALTLTGQHAAALDHLERAVAIRERVSGPDHLESAKLHHNMGEVLRSLTRYDEALEHHARAGEVFRRELGERHQMVAMGLEHTAGVLLDLGRASEAVVMLERALSMFDEAVGARSLDAARCRINLADALRRVGRHARALSIDRRALEVVDAVVGPDTIYGGFANMGIGQDLLGLGRAAEAAAPLERAASALEASGVDAVELARVRFALARALTGRGRPPARARELAEAASRALAASDRGEPAALRREVERWQARSHR
jgi:tetratricopeptide (TPR) repeat protein/predicted Ser/Thr protein kinase